MSNQAKVTVIPAKPQMTDNKKQYRQLRVAAYCRVSTEQEEQQNSYQVQIAYYTDLINRKKEWSMVQIFADEGISGTQAKKRPAFLRMIRLCKQGKIDLIITKSISRFARNTVESLEYVRQLKDMGIGVIFEKENINTLTMTSEFMIALYSSFAQAESESISKNVTWGVQKAYAEGKVTLHYKDLLGYKKGENNEPEIVPEEAETVKMIFSLYLDGHTFQNIVDIMIRKNRLTSHGNTNWRPVIIQRILKNEKYVGDVLLQKTFTVDCITKKVQKNKGERPMYLVTDHHKPIIDRDTFNRVQQELIRRSSKRRVSDKALTEQGKYSAKYALSELLICGNCGTPYRRQIWKNKNNRYAVWRCISRLDHGKKYCTNSPTLHEDKLHKTILKAVNEYLGCRNEIAKILKANIGTVMECKDQQEILSLENRLKELDKARSDIILLISSGKCDEDAMDTEFAKIYAEEQTINEQLTELKENVKISEDTKNKIDNAMGMLEQEKFELDVFDNIIIRKLIECIKVLSKTEILIIFKGGIEVKAEIEE